MAGVISARAGLSHSLSVTQTVLNRPLQASQLATRCTSPSFLSAKLCKTRPLVVAAAMEVSKEAPSADFANRQPSKGCC